MSPKSYAWLVRLASWGLGGVFIYAGMLKVADPLAFADSVATFLLLPVALITPVALTLPVVEILLGVSLVLCVKRKLCAAMLGILCVLFAVALVQALMRGLEVDCGCFGSGSPSMVKTLWAVVRDAGLGALAWWVWRNERSAVAPR